MLKLTMTERECTTEGELTSPANQLHTLHQTGAAQQFSNTLGLFWWTPQVSLFFVIRPVSKKPVIRQKCKQAVILVQIHLLPL